MPVVVPQGVKKLVSFFSGPFRVRPGRLRQRDPIGESSFRLPTRPRPVDQPQCRNRPLR